MTSTITKLSYDGNVARALTKTKQFGHDAAVETSLAQVELVTAAEWDKIAARFTDLIPEQMGCFNTGHWGEENLEFAVVKAGETVIGGGVVIIKTIPFSNTGIAILKWGPLCQQRGEAFSLNRYAEVVACLKHEYCVKRNFNLTVMPCAKPDVSERCEETLIKMDFKIGEGLAAPERYIVNVHDGAETLKANLDQKWRYNMRKSLKNDLEIKLVDAREGLDEFLGLYGQMIERKKFLDASAIGALEDIIRNSPTETRPLMLLVYHNGALTAGGVFHASGDMSSYMFGATDDRALPLKAGYAMHWWMAEYLCGQDDIQWYYLGGNDLDKGLHQFKKGFVGKSGHILLAPPRYHFSNSFSASVTGFAAFRARSILSSLKRFSHSLLSRK